MEAKCHIAGDEIAIDGVFRRDWNLEWPPHAAATVCAAWEARKRSLTHSLSLSLFAQKSYLFRPSFFSSSVPQVIHQVSLCPFTVFVH